MLHTLTPPPAQNQRQAFRRVPRCYYRPEPPGSVRASTPATQRSQSWTVEIRLTGAQRRQLPAWRSPETWLEQLSTALHAASHNGTSIQLVEGKRWSRACIAIDSVIAVAAADAATADRRTGRNVQTSHLTVAKRLGCASTTVRRARRVIEMLGYASTLQLGRYLTAEEREAARRAHGRDQRRIASQRVLTIPRPHVQVDPDVKVGTLPRRGLPTSTTHLSTNSPTRATARTGVVTRPAAINTRSHRRATVHTLASGLERLLPHLTRRNDPVASEEQRRHLFGELCRTLRVLKLRDGDWTPRDLLNLLDARNLSHGLYPIPGSHQRDPLALLAHQLRLALQERPTESTPGYLRRERERRAAMAARERQLREQLHERQVVAERADLDVQRRHAARMKTLRAHLRQVTQQSVVDAPDRVLPDARAWRTKTL